MRAPRLGLVLTLCAVAQGQTAIETPPVAIERPVSGEFVSLFSAWCLQGFPDSAAVDAQVARNKAHAMTPSQLGEYLYMGKGRGWAMAGRDGNYIVTDEQPPNRACTLRRYSDDAYSTAPMLETVQRFVWARGHSLSPPKTRDQMVTTRVRSHATLYDELDAKGRPTGAQYAFERLSYGVGRGPDGRPLTGFWEIRFTRQIAGRPI